MQEAITLAMKMAGGRSQSDLASDGMLAMALTRCLEVLGEAASKLSAEVRQQFPAIPFVSSGPPFLKTFLRFPAT